MKDKSRKRRQAIRLMDKQNERMRWLYSIQQGQKRRMEGRVQGRNRERERDSNDGGNKRKLLLQQRRRGDEGEMNRGLQ